MDAPQVEPSPRGVSQYVPDGLFLVCRKLVTGLMLLLFPCPEGRTVWACSVPKGEIRLDSSNWRWASAAMRAETFSNVVPRAVERIWEIDEPLADVGMAEVVVDMEV